MPDTAATVDARETWLACLCAAWCGTCAGYRATFDALAAAHPGVRFAWIDIEDHADALADAAGREPEIDDFPTLLLLRGGQPLFFGPVLPHAAVAARLLAEAGTRPVLGEPQALAVARAVRALAAQGMR